MVTINYNSFLDGMNRDRLRSLSDNKQYQLARNAIMSNGIYKNFGLVNERSNRLVSETGGGVVATAYCEEKNSTFIFKMDDSIHMFNHDTKETVEVMNAGEFGCSWNFKECEWLGNNIQFKTLEPCSELYVYFSSNLVYYKVNIDLMLDPKRKQGLIDELNCDTKCGLENNCEYFKVSKFGCAPKINARAINNKGGGQLLAGAYTFVARLRHTDGGETNWFHFSEPAYVGSDHNVAGEQTSSYIDVSITGLDCKFAELELAVIENVGGIITAKTLNTFNYSNQRFSYRYNGNDGNPIDIRELLVKDKVYLKGKHLQQKDGHMLYYGIQSRKNPNLQKYASDIDTEWVSYRIPYSHVKKYSIKSLMRGESYAFGIVYNYADGSHSHAFHIPAKFGGGGGSSNLEGNADAFEYSGSGLKNGQEVIRSRKPKEDSVSNPQNDHYDKILEDIINSYTTNSASICEEIKLWEEYLGAACCGCEGSKCEGGTAYDQCVADLGKSEEVFAKWADLVSEYTLDDIEPTYTSDFIYDGAKRLYDSIVKRERKTTKKRVYETAKSGGGSYSFSGVRSENGTFGTNLFDTFGLNETEVDIEEIDSGRTTVKEETNIKYPCQTDCEGNFIYGELAGERVRHHKFPRANQSPHFYSKSEGVPHGTFFPDASPEADLYINIMGARFSNIGLPTDDELPLPLCPNNPYTIVMVERTDANKTVLMKGVGTGTFQIDANGKPYDHPRYGLNSPEHVSFYHDDGRGNRIASGASGTSHTLYSLDGSVLKPPLPATRMIEEMEMIGKGERYGLYFKGEAPDDAIRGRRVDSLGAVQAINLSAISSTALRSNDVEFVEYVLGDESASPGSGGGSGLMNKSGQPCVWVRSNARQIEDGSFTGDVLDHNVPIMNGRGQYFSLIRDLDDQYGNLENLNYIPFLQSGKGGVGTIEGPHGDVFIGMYSFVKTGFVSDKVGDCSEDGKFNIPYMVPTKSEKRCICDGPEDAVNQQVGNYVWTELPEEGDKADPKNWAGTHTRIAQVTKTYSESVGKGSESDMYLPGTTTTNIMYVGEFEACPWLRQKTDNLSDQFFGEIKKPDFRFVAQHAVDGEGIGWKDAFLNQYHREIVQPSLWQKLLKVVIRTALTIIFPAYGLNELFDITNGGVELVGNIAEFPIMLVIWYLMMQVLFTNETVDKMLGIPVCKTDDKNGFKENDNRGLFFNYSGYNIDYSTKPNIYTYQGIPDPYYTCECDDETNNTIYISDRQNLDSLYDAYTHIRPLSKIQIPASFGNLTNLFVVGGDLYAHTTDAIIPIRRNRAAISTDVGDILIGANGFLLEPEGIITEGITEGYSGLQRHNEHIDTQYGYIFIDSEADIIYTFQGQSAANTNPSRGSLQAISMEGMYNFFKNKLPFCNKTECIDERVTGTSYYSLGVDPRFNRLLVTKSDGEYSFTASYSFETGKWVSLHDYIPRDYIWDRRDMYTLNDEGIWLHNDDNSFLTFYGEQKPFVVEFTVIPALGQEQIYALGDSFVFNSLVLNTEATKYVKGSCLEDLDVTFNKLAVFNSSQGTGTKEVAYLSDDAGEGNSIRDRIKDISKIRATKSRRLWNINEIKDYLATSEGILTCEKCEVYEQINEPLFDAEILGKKDFKNKVVNDKYLTFRFTYDADTETELRLISATTKGEKRDV